MFKKLPANDYTVYTFDIPSLGVTKRFRPFLVKESKALMIANGTNQNTVMLETLKNVIQSTCLDEIDVDSLAIFDFEYLLIKLRTISASDPIDILLKCDGEEHENNPSGDIPVHVDLSKVEVANINSTNKNITIGENKMVIMKYPDLAVLSELNKDQSQIDYIKVLSKCIDQIIVGDEIYGCDEISKEDMEEWVNTLDNASFMKLVAFFDDLPYTRVKVEFDCPTCGKHNIRYLVGLNAFF